MGFKEGLKEQGEECVGWGREKQKVGVKKNEELGDTGGRLWFFLNNRA